MSSQSTDFRVSPETMAELRDLERTSDIEDVLTIFKALSDEHRLDIMRFLDVSELCVCDLVEIFDIEYSKLSYHLKQLKEANLVTADRDGNYVTYRPTDRGEEVIDIIHRIY
ncbi:MAG: ArsR/SmtB family transcription factor [Halodesulfurarchaeum sp.]